MTDASKSAGNSAAASRLRLLTGDGMTADDAAWKTVADAALTAQKTPGLSEASAVELAALERAALRCARQLPPRSPAARHLT